VISPRRGATPRAAGGRLLAVLAYVAFIFALSSWQHPPSGPRIAHLDKILHVIEYAGLGVLIFRAAELRLGGGRLVLTVVLCGLLVATADEIYQGTIPGRTPGPTDATADLLGVALGAGFMRWRRRAGARTGSDLMPERR
jgi:VanZ family protein